jgi:hypothetical protein
MRLRRASAPAFFDNVTAHVFGEVRVNAPIERSRPPLAYARATRRPEPPAARASTASRHLSFGGADGKTLERRVTAEVFPTAADVPGSVNHAGQSSIKSQHFLRNQKNQQSTYGW